MMGRGRTGRWETQVERNFFPLGYFWSHVNVFFIHDYLNIVIIISAILLCCSVAKSCPALCDPMNYSTPGFPVLHYLPEFVQLMSIESMMPSNCLILCHPLLLLPSINSFNLHNNHICTIIVFIL